MLINPVPITESEMLLSWARAEIPERWRNKTPPHLAKIETCADLDSKESAEVIAFIRRVRGEVEHFLDGRATWYAAELPIQALGAVTLDAYWIWTALGVGGTEPLRPWCEPPLHPRTIAELLSHPDAPKLTITGEFNFVQARGTPICVATDIGGPLQVMEGSNRLRAMWRDFASGKPTPTTVAVVVGVHPLKSHLNDRHRGLWDRFSIYLTIDHSHLKEMESLILRIVRTPGNKVKGKFARSENLERRLKRDIKRRQDDEVRALLGRPPRLSRASAGADGREERLRPLKGVFAQAITMRRNHRGKLHKARVRRDGTIRFKGRTFDSPSAAASAACGRSVSGWQFWRYEQRPGKWVRLVTVRR